MCGGGGSKSSTPPQPVDVKTVANPSRREQAGAFTNTPGNVATTASTNQTTFGSELGGTGG